MRKIQYFKNGDKKQNYQGDIVAVKINAPKNLKYKPLKEYVVAEGETTGNKHILVAEPEAQVEFAEDANGVFIKVKSGSVKLTGHREHSDIDTTVVPNIFTAGEWYVGRQNEYDPLEKWRKVQD